MKKFFPLFAVIIVLVLAVCSFHIIPTGYTGVKTSFGQIQKTTIQSGKLNFCMLITKPSSRSPLHRKMQIRRRSRVKPPLPSSGVEAVDRNRSAIERRGSRGQNGQTDDLHFSTRMGGNFWTANHKYCTGWHFAAGALCRKLGCTPAGSRN